MRSAVSHSSCSTWAMAAAPSVQPQPLLGDAQRQEDDHVIAVKLRARAQIAEDLGHPQPRTWIGGQFLALLDDRPRDRVGEHPFRQGHAHRRALALLAQRVLGDEPDLDRQPGPGIGRQIVIAGRLRLFQVQAGQRQIELQLRAGLGAGAA